MRFPQGVLLVLALCAAVLPVGLLAGWAAPGWAHELFGTDFERWMLVGFCGSVGLMAWMLLHRARSSLVKTHWTMELRRP